MALPSSFLPTNAQPERELQEISFRRVTISNLAT
jgi:hypothetical protein